MSSWWISFIVDKHSSLSSLNSVVNVGLNLLFTIDMGFNLLFLISFQPLSFFLCIRSMGGVRLGDDGLDEMRRHDIVMREFHRKRTLPAGH